MSESTTQVIGATTVSGGIAVLPYTGVNPLVETLQLIARVGFFMCLCMLVLHILFKLIENRQRKLQIKQKKSFFSAAVGIQIIVLYLTVSSLLALPWLSRPIHNRHIAYARTQHFLFQEKKTEGQPEFISGTPRHMKVRRLRMDLDIVNGHFENNEWTLSKSKVLFATNTTKPNNYSDNTVLYGHNTASVLRDTQSLKIGDELELDTQEGFQFIYRFDHDKNVKPNDTSVFSHTTTPQLTLITCNGRFNSHRRLMTFTLTSVRKLQ